MSFASSCVMSCKLFIRRYLISLKFNSSVPKGTKVTSEKYSNSCNSWLSHFHTSSCHFKVPKAAQKVIKPIKEKATSIGIWKNMTVSELADQLSKNIDDVYEAMVFVDNTENYDKPLSKIDDLKVIQNIVKKMGLRTIIVPAPGALKEDSSSVKDIEKRPTPDPKDLVKRPPVVTIMGHVDHGKTTLLDTLRHTSVVKQEFGGITQHIGAFSVKVKDGETVTFLDTPGHAAFSSMRARGAHVTDIVVLVVAADDGVMEQTIESLRYAREANVPFIVAINKIDKPKIDLENVVRSLLVHGVQLEEQGGEIQSVKISALKGLNLEDLIESILALAEVLNICADPKGLMEGIVLESKADPGRGKLATVLVQRGTLTKGNFIVAGTAWGKVRSLFDEWGKNLESVSPGNTAQVIGWRELPGAGEEILEVESEKRAKQVVDLRLKQEAQAKISDDVKAINEKLAAHLVEYKQDLEKRKSSGRLRKRRQYVARTKQNVEDTFPRLNIVLKGDVDGSVEAILDIIETYNCNHICKFDVVHFGVGHVTPSDVELAEMFSGIVYAFNVKASKELSKQAEALKVVVKDFKVIYKLIDDIKEELTSRIPPMEVDENIGEASVLEEFIVSEGKKKHAVAGCHCTTGILKKSALFRVLRGSEVMHEGKLLSMRHLKAEVESIKKDVECGLMLEDSEIRFVPGDKIVCFEKKEVAQKIEWNPGF